ncbi:ABC transporter permease [Oceanisphaera sp. W20_SRM_FM3]|uniref:ABC transporter permease n=1 Tax=Oceanisphaera sp. W20_SRM_FM3 TaxID=3240267 RepID=UPI003F9E134D
MISNLERLRLLSRLALQDLWHDRKVSFCITASLVAVIAPLLLLFGLKHGVVDQLQQELLQDPANLQVRMLSSGHYTDDWLDTLRARPEVGFAIGQTRSLNTQADLIRDRSHFIESAEVLPTAAQDPLLDTPLSALSGNQIMLSEPAARRLNTNAGDTIKLRVTRRLAGVNERGELELTVVAVLDAARFGRPAVFVALPLLIELERFRDGFRLPNFGPDTGSFLNDKAAVYARARIYAQGVDQVAALEQWLNSENIETSSRLREIDNVKAINRVLGLIFGVVALTALIGCIASLVGAFLANIDRKHKDLALLRLLGFTRSGIALYVILQAIFISLVAYVGGLSLYWLGSELFDYTLNTSEATGQFACHITPLHGLIALLLSLTVAVLVSLIGAVRAVNIQPAESLREL